MKRKNDGVCWMAGAGSPCGGPTDAAHAFPRGACPAVRYDPDFGEPLCRLHHQHYGNGKRWRAVLFKRWGAAVYAERYVLAHGSRRKSDLTEVLRRLSG